MRIEYSYHFHADRVGDHAHSSDAPAGEDLRNACVRPSSTKRAPPPPPPPPP
eukprot:COSAG02_NODE_3277_length_7027_cov_19.864463_9_plen_51_part_01